MWTRSDEGLHLSRSVYKTPEGEVAQRHVFVPMEGTLLAYLDRRNHLNDIKGRAKCVCLELRGRLNFSSDDHGVEVERDESGFGLGLLALMNDINTTSLDVDEKNAVADRMLVDSKSQSGSKKFAGPVSQ